MLKKLTNLAFCLSATITAAAVVSAAEPERIETGDTVVVSEDGARFGVGPSFIELRKGTKVKVTSLKEDWVGGYMVSNGKKEAGWVKRNQVQLVAEFPPEVPPIEVEADRVRMENPWRFYAVNIPEGELPRDLVVSQLWTEDPTTVTKIRSKRDKRLLLGVERDATPADVGVADFSFTMPTGMILSGEGARMSLHGTTSFPYGVFFEGRQPKTLWDGVIRWDWKAGVFIEPAEGEDGAIFALKEAQPAPFIKPLVAPLLQGREIELQVVVKDNKPALIRKLFALEKGGVDDLDLGADKPNTGGEAQFKSRFTTVTDSEKQAPEITATVSAGDTSKQDIPFDNTETILSSSMRCTSRHNAPDFLDLNVSFDGWKGTTVKLSLEVKASSTAPTGDHYFRLIHRAEWDKGPIYRERVILVSIK